MQQLKTLRRRDNLAYHTNITAGQQRNGQTNNKNGEQTMPYKRQNTPNMQDQQSQSSNQQPLQPPTVPTGYAQVPDSLLNPYYSAGFLRQFIGSNMRVEYLLGTNGPLVDRVGELVDVGANYIVLKPFLSDDILMTDLYSIRFVTIYDQT